MKHSINIDELAHLYVAEGLTHAEIGARVNVPSRTVHRYLEKAGVPLRRRTDAKHKQLATRQWLEERYVARGLSTTQIGREVGCVPRHVSWWLARHGIKARMTGSEAGHSRHSEESRTKLSVVRKGRFTGSEHPRWKGGPQHHYRDPARSSAAARRWVKAVKERDGWQCVECGSTDRLHAHHIARWVDRPDLRFALSNGATLCHACHEKAHGRRLDFRWLKYVKRPKSAPHPSNRRVKI